MDLLVQDQGHLLARNLSYGSSDTKSGLLAGQEPRRQKGGLTVCMLSKTMELLRPCTPHFFPRSSVPKKAELGDPMSPKKRSGAWVHAGMG